MSTWVLIVDDDADNRELLAELLDSSGYTAVTCGSAEEATKILDEKGCPSLVIADVRLPDEDGPSFIRRMRTRPGFSNAPAVFVTGATPDGSSALRDPVLVKPVDLEVLVTLVSQHYVQAPGPALPS